MIHLKNGASESEIAGFEQKAQMSLPQDYRLFLQQSNGCFSDLEPPVVIEKDSVFAVYFQHLLSLTRGNRGSLYACFAEYRSDIPQQSLIIGSATAGFILYIFDGVNDGIYLYDHALAFDASTPDHNTYRIFPDFKSLLRILS